MRLTAVASLPPTARASHGDWLRFPNLGKVPAVFRLPPVWCHRPWWQKRDAASFHGRADVAGCCDDEAPGIGEWDARRHRHRSAPSHPKEKRCRGCRNRGLGGSCAKKELAGTNAAFPTYESGRNNVSEAQNEGTKKRWPFRERNHRFCENREIRREPLRALLRSPKAFPFQRRIQTRSPR